MKSTIREQTFLLSVLPSFHPSVLACIPTCTVFIVHVLFAVTAQDFVSDSQIANLLMI